MTPSKKVFTSGAIISHIAKATDKFIAVVDLDNTSASGHDEFRYYYMHDYKYLEQCVFNMPNNVEKRELLYGQAKELLDDLKLYIKHKPEHSRYIHKEVMPHLKRVLAHREKASLQDELPLPPDFY